MRPYILVYEHYTQGDDGKETCIERFDSKEEMTSALNALYVEHKNADVFNVLLVAHILKDLKIEVVELVKEIRLA